MQSNRFVLGRIGLTASWAVDVVIVRIQVELKGCTWANCNVLSEVQEWLAELGETEPQEGNGLELRQTCSWKGEIAGLFWWDFGPLQCASSCTGAGTLPLSQASIWRRVRWLSGSLKPTRHCHRCARPCSIFLKPFCGSLGVVIAGSWVWAEKSKCWLRYLGWRRGLCSGGYLFISDIDTLYFQALGNCVVDFHRYCMQASCTSPPLPPAQTSLFFKKWCLSKLASISRWHSCTYSLPLLVTC